MDINESLRHSLETSYIDRSAPSPEILQSRLIKNSLAENIKVISTIQRSLENCEEFMFSVAFITKGGLLLIQKTLKELEEKGVRGKILTTNYLNFNEPDILHKLLEFKNIEVKISDGNFHTKCFIFKYKNYFDIITGSSNLTHGALTTNQEWNIKTSSLEDGAFTNEIIDSFNELWNKSNVLTEEWIQNYEQTYVKIQTTRDSQPEIRALVPNLMQREALNNLAELRIAGKNKALLISATGTGKTYLSAFDVKASKAKRMLFVIHREQIAREALKSFQNIFGDLKTYSILSGANKNTNADFVFATIQSLSKDETLYSISADLFDYIIIDEAHRAGAGSYKKILDYFKPKFLLGMTATPERSDGYNLYELFDYNIAYEIRLKKALESDLLCPFHYFGISDITIDGVDLDEYAAFNYLISKTRIDYIIDKIKFYGYSGDRVRGLIFCSRVEEAKKLSEEFNMRGFRTVSLDGANSQAERLEYTKRLQQDKDDNNALDYIFTVDIFNEGVDIPKINQVVMLRPTQSAIIFVQQLGRGLRKAPDKEYVVVLDFIGNYVNNFLIPIALSGDRTLNKDALRKYVIEGVNLLYGASTIMFDRISERKIFDSINKTNFSALKNLRGEYENLKIKIGRIPSLYDFYKFGSIDPQIILKSYGSYYDFLQKVEKDININLSFEENLILRYISCECCDGKRLEELIIVRELIRSGKILVDDLIKILGNYGIKNKESIKSAVRVLDSSFLTQVAKNRYKNISLVKQIDREIILTDFFRSHLSKNLLFYLNDAILYAIKLFEDSDNSKLNAWNLRLFSKYSRRDVCRLLCWPKDESATLYGYQVKYNSCPIFVTLNKSEDISESTKYIEGFVNRNTFNWKTRSRVRLDSKDVVALRDYKKNNIQLHLFVKKADAEGSDFYYLGEVHPSDFRQNEIATKDKKLPIVDIRLALENNVRDDIYDYLTR